MVRLKFQTASLKTIRADVAAAFVFEDKDLFRKRTQAIDRMTGKSLRSLLQSKDFSGKEGEVSVVYAGNAAKSGRLMLIGLGEQKKLTVEKLRRAVASATKRAKSMKLRRVGLEIPEYPTVSKSMKARYDIVVQALCEGAALSVYDFDKYRSKNDGKKPKTVEQVILFSDNVRATGNARRAVNQAQIICEAVYLARGLQNAPSNEIYPESLAQTAKRVGRMHHFRTRIFDRKTVRRLGMGGVVAVSQGSSKPPRFIVMEYGRKGRGKTVVLVGKGVTFDTGGISLKPSSNMAEMKMDMSGAAAVIGTFEAVARLKLPVHLVGLIPAVENMPSGTAIKPGDIVRHYNGKTSEVDNTDAEGRLILADALGYAAKFKPAAVIDLATLTGACVVALGHHATGMMGNDDMLMEKLKAAGEVTYERTWPLPLYDEYESQIKSDVADVKNVGGRWAGAITAGWFLKKFIGKYKWVHLDIAGTAILEEPQEYAPKGGSGVGVRLLVEFLREWSKTS
ncbi:MAG: leucyl aminopeptidase [Bacteroidota bacterium]